MRYLIVIFLLCSWVISPIFADESHSNDNILAKKKLQPLVQAYLNNYGKLEKITAIALSVKQADGDPVSFFDGFTDESQQKAVQAQNLFQMGSIVKSFVAVITLKLVSDPHYDFNLEDKVTKFLPEYTHWSAISIRQLLNMTSGIPDFFIYRNILETWSAHPYHYIPPQHWLREMHDQSLLFTPGSRFSYSNTNYFLLGLIIEKLTGKRLDQVMQEKLFSPYGLNHTYIVMHHLPNHIKQHLVRGYQQEQALAPYLRLGSDVSDYSLSYLFASGSIVSTTEDILRWIDVLFKQQQVLTPQEFNLMNQLISQKTGRELQAVTPQDPLAFGLGISVHYSPKMQTAIYLYEGITAGYRTAYVYVPTKQLTVVVAVNSSYTGKENHLIALINQVASIIL